MTPRLSLLRGVGLLAIMGGPIYVHEWLGAALPDGVAWTLALAPVLLMLVGTLGFDGIPAKAQSRYFVWTGSLGATLLALLEVAALGHWLTGGPPIHPTGWLGIVAGTGAVGWFAMMAQRFFALPRALEAYNVCPACERTSVKASSCPVCGWRFDGTAHGDEVANARFSETEGALIIRVAPPSRLNAGLSVGLGAAVIVGVWWSGGSRTISESQLIAYSVVSLVVAIGMYAGVARWTNELTIRLDDVSMSFARGPLPWPAGPPIPVSDIEDVYLDSLLDRDGRAQEVRVHVRLGSGERQMIAAGLKTGAAAQAVVERIEARLFED